MKMTILVVDEPNVIRDIFLLFSGLLKTVSAEISVIALSDAKIAEDVLCYADVAIIDLYRTEWQRLFVAATKKGTPTIALHDFRTKTCPPDIRTVRFVTKSELVIGDVCRILEDFSKYIEEQRRIQGSTKKVSVGSTNRFKLTV